MFVEAKNRPGGFVTTTVKASIGADFLGSPRPRLSFHIRKPGAADVLQSGVHCTGMLTKRLATPLTTALGVFLSVAFKSVTVMHLPGWPFLEHFRTVSCIHRDLEGSERSRYSTRYIRWSGGISPASKKRPGSDLERS